MKWDGLRQVLMHDKPSKHKNWAAHAINGWYIGTSAKHYRCFKIWNKETRNVRVSDTVFFKHKYLTNPSVSAQDALMQAAKQLTDAL